MDKRVVGTMNLLPVALCAFAISRVQLLLTEASGIVLAAEGIPVLQTLARTVSESKQWMHSNTVVP
eukprot:5683721-Amphidinium_carterae.1